MVISCPRCKTRLTLSDDKVKPEGTKFKCVKCGTTLRYKGKGRQVPKGDIPESSASPPFPPAEETAGPQQAASDAGTKTGHKESELRETDNASQAVPAQLSALYSAGETTKAVRPVRTVIAGACALIILVLAAIFFVHSGGKTPGDQTNAARTDTEAANSPSSDGKGPVAAGDSENEAAGEDGRTVPAEDTALFRGPAATTGEEAIELVKRSDALLKRTSVESIIEIWTRKNAANYQIVGWQAENSGEGKYLVSYTALDGDKPKGFYFELDAQSGAVVDLARNPELQNRYNIQYSGQESEAFINSGQ